MTDALLPKLIREAICVLTRQDEEALDANVTWKRDGEAFVFTMRDKGDVDCGELLRHINKGRNFDFVRMNAQNEITVAVTANDIAFTMERRERVKPSFKYHLKKENSNETEAYESEESEEDEEFVPEEDDEEESNDDETDDLPTPPARSKKRQLANAEDGVTMSARKKIAIGPSVDLRRLTKVQIDMMLLECGATDAYIASTTRAAKLKYLRAFSNGTTVAEDAPTSSLIHLDGAFIGEALLFGVRDKDYTISDFDHTMIYYSHPRSGPLKLAKDLTQFGNAEHVVGFEFDSLRYHHEKGNVQLEDKDCNVLLRLHIKSYQLEKAADEE